MPKIVQGSSTNTVIVDRQRTATAVTERSRSLAVTNTEVVRAVSDAPRTITASTTGVQGPAGVSNILDTDALPEGNTNLYFTTDRFADAFDSAMEVSVQSGVGMTLEYDSEVHTLTATNTDRGSVALAGHENLLDPHPQYIADSEIIDGGNF